MFKLIIVLVSTLLFCNFILINGEISEKGRKFADSSPQNVLARQEEQKSILSDDFFDFEEEEDPFGEFGSDDETIKKPLVPCYNLTEAEIANGTLCEDIPPPEPRFEDLLLQKLIAQVWSDFQAKLKSGTLRGRVIDPLDIDALLKEPISLKQSGSVYKADVNMSDIKLYGLSDIYLDQSSVTRDENLTDLFVDVRFAFDALIINGTYSMKGFMGWWALDSQGEQTFSITMRNATFSVRFEMDTLAGRTCSRSEEGDVLITKIEMPLEYEDIDFRFKKLGDFANNVVNGVGIYFLQTQETVLVNAMKKAIKDKVNSLIC